MLSQRSDLYIVINFPPLPIDKQLKGTSTLILMFFLCLFISHFLINSCTKPQ